MLRTIPRNEDGTFQAPAAHFGFSGIEQILVADLNGDGRPDLLTASAIFGSEVKGPSSTAGAIGVLMNTTLVEI